MKVKKDEGGFDFDKFKKLYTTKYINEELKKEQSSRRKQGDRSRLQNIIEEEEMLNQGTYDSVISARYSQGADVLSSNNLRQSNQSNAFSKTSANPLSSSMIKDKNGLSLTQKIMLSYDPQSKMALGQTGRRRVNLTQMIRNRPPKQAKKLPKGEKPPPVIKADYMFQVTSRQIKYKNFLPDTQSPAIGQYSPRYDQILGRKPAFKIREETKDYSGDERINQSLQQMVINQIKCSKFPKKIYELHKAQVENSSLDRIQASQDDMVLSGAGGSSPRKQYDDQSPTKAMENPALEDSLLSPNLLTDQQHIQSPRTTSNNLMKSTRLSIDLDDPMLKKQSHLEALYGKNVRDLSPNANKHANQSVSGTNKSLTRSHIDEITLFNQYLKNLPNIEFKKQPPKDSYLDKITGNVHHKRFDSFDNFPRIFSKNKKIIVNLDIGKLSGRDEFAKPQNNFIVNCKQRFLFYTLVLQRQLLSGCQESTCCIQAKTQSFST